MPRLTFKQFYARHKELRKAWEDPISYFLSLEPHQQWYLHEYYRPSEILIKEQLRTHWKALHDQSTPLHQQAGRAYARLKPFLDGKPYYLVPPERQAKSAKEVGNVVVRGTVNPRPDVELMADVVIMLGRELVAETGVIQEGDS